MKYISAIMSIGLMSACAHRLEKPEDLRLNESYPVLGAQEVEARVCELKAQNIFTVMPTKAGPLPMALIGQTAAVVCGPIDCSKTGDKVPSSMWYCGPFELLLEPQSSKSE